MSTLVFDLVSYNYQLLVVTNTWACVPRATPHMRMDKSYKYPPRFTPSTFGLVNPFGWARVGGTIDMLDFAFFI